MKIKNITSITLSIFTLTILSFSSITKTVMPEIKGIYTIFSPDTIGMGQALMRKRWIENVHFYSPEGNLAKAVVKRFWNKREEGHPLEVSNVALISNMTPEIFGKLLNYVDILKKINNIDTIQKTKKDVINPWVNTFRSEKNKKKENLIKEIEILAAELKNKKSTQSSIIENATKSSKYRKQQAAIASTKAIKEVKESTSNKPEIKEIKILVLEKIRDAENKQINEETNAKIDDIKKEITELTKNIKNKTGAIKTLDFTEKDAEKLEAEVNSLINSIEVLVKSEGKDFIEGTTEAILWAFFEKKFTRKDALKNFLICLNQFENKQYLARVLGKEKYLESDKSKFENELEQEASAEDKIKKITADYDVSTYSAIQSAALEVLPPKVSQGKLFYEYKKQNTKEDFPTCFETAFLDIISILLYDPEEKKYDLDLITQEMRGALFSDITENVFKEIDEKTKKREVILPNIIDSRLQSWINIISNQPEIRYNRDENRAGETVRFDLNTTFENLIKILNKIFNLGLVIADDRDKLIIENTDLINNPEDIKEFLEKIFEYISEKLSINDRSIRFELIEGPNKGGEEEYALAGNKVEIAGYYTGIVKVSISHKDSNNNSNFLINIEPGHAYITDKIREMSGLTYHENFITLLTDKFYSKEKDSKKLTPLFVLLSNPKMIRKLDTQEYNLFIYCLKLKDSQEKSEFIINAIKTGAIEVANISKLVYKLLQELPEDPALIDRILDEILKLKVEQNSDVEKMLKNICDKAEKSTHIAKLILEKLIKKIEYIKNKPEIDNIDKLVQELFEKHSEDEKFITEILNYVFANKFELNPAGEKIIKNIYNKAKKSTPIAKIFTITVFGFRGVFSAITENINITKLMQELFEKLPNDEKLLPEDMTFIAKILKYLSSNINPTIAQTILKIIYDKAEKSASIAKVVLGVAIETRIFYGSKDSFFKIIDAASFDSKELDNLLDRHSETIEIRGGESPEYIEIDEILEERYAKNSAKLISYIEANNTDEAMKLIKDPETNINGFEYDRPLDSAVNENSILLVQNILEHKNKLGEPDVNFNNETLHHALNNEKVGIEIVKLLLNYKNKNGEYCINDFNTIKYIKKIKKSKHKDYLESDKMKLVDEKMKERSKLKKNK